ncbi:MAG: hypothetical protein OK449_02830 [Thaumarchaeota archaeon]|nr:hypothetical protein [Nitrososphaerota archaeon]
MKTLVNIPGRQNLDIPVYDSKVPKPEDVTILNPALLKTVIILGFELKDLGAKWAIGGDAGEIIKGVHLKTDYIEILTTKEGCDEICKLVPQYVTLPAADAEKKLPREADVEGKMFPVYVKSRYAELTVNKVKVEVYGDEQIKVGEWDWGDALDFEPDYSYIVDRKVPIVPLRLKSELDLGLGWLDRLELISAAIMSGMHHLAEGGVRPTK